MKEQKRPKLSLKRKQSILPGPSENNTNAASINTFTLKKTQIIAKGDFSNQVSVANTSCASRSVCNKSNDGLQNVICISDDDDDKNDRLVGKKARHSSETEERGNDSKMSNQASTFLVSRSGFLNVDNQDLRKLRESFLNHRNIKAVDIKSLRDLPCHQVLKTDDNSNNNGNRNSFNNEKSNNNENQNGLNNKIVDKTENSNTNLNDISNDYVTNVHSLSLLPPLCKWCRNRKPVSLHDQYPYEAFWSFDKNLPRDSSPIFNKSELTDKLMKTEESQKTEKTEIIFGEKETSRLDNTKCNDVKSSFKRQPLFKNSQNFSTSNCTNVAEKMDVSCDSHISKVVPQVSNKSQIQETTIELIKQKNLGTNKSYDVERHDSNAETRRNFGISTKMENADVLKHDTKSVYFAGKRKDHVKTSGSSDEIMKPEFASKKSYDSCNDNRKKFNDNDDNSLDKVNCNVSNDNNVEKDGSSEIETCPLCQTVFEKGMKQIDKDGHIAACFAASSDDVAW